MVVEVKILLQEPYQVLVAISNWLLEVWGLFPFTRTLLRVPLVHSNFDLGSTS